eukprot:TRINITY_DN2230_c1_g1_i2.p1 TRINITY_DN2230_c1_g1~~TRINITY_DN2230_c1_g1_i2.p1  ORF type:complete len:309 (-),score=56.34 TRINITY_DN2230_c1_g1_i2:270-1196(-)
MRRGGIGSAISYVKYMINNTDAERRRALPQYLKREDWETFVDSEGSLDAELRRRVGKAARASLKSPHTSGRKGQARVADELQQQHPEREVTRCEIFIKTHYKKDGTASSHHVERLSRMCDYDPFIARNDIDNAGVAKVFGTDTRVRVRGLGLGVSRSIMHNSNPYKRAYEEEHKSHVALETEVDGLKSRMADMEKIVASLSQSGTQMRSSTDHESSSQVRPPSTHQVTQASSRSTLPAGTYELMHLRKSTVVAFGSLMGVSPDNSDCYRIVIDEIVDGDIKLMDGVRKMEDIMVADIIDWPIFRTFPC